MTPSKSEESTSGLAAKADEIAETVHDYTERNIQTVNYWVSNKQEQLGSTENIGLAVVINVAMTLLGLAVWAAPWGIAMDVVGVAWAVLNARPLVQALWGWLA